MSKTHNSRQRTRIPVTYRDEWQDGLGARGWKLDTAMTDSTVIASTAYTGENVPTSVLIHDILDHLLCGFGFSGHRNEAMAVVQLASRTGADAEISFCPMAEEVMRGLVPGESIETFLPDQLKRHLPDGPMSNEERMSYLSRRLGKQRLRSLLLAHFQAIGEEGIGMAKAHWHKAGLDYDRRTAIGLCLQELLVQADAMALTRRWQHARGNFLVGNRECKLNIESPEKHELRQPVNDGHDIIENNMRLSL
ncbi:MAG TPA: hypothetical protein ENJ12_04380 [Thiolapillus brandeum]|uniref:Uncharacterized protein n=1 Tax=Thiolapillus brandeum TaxID=1076588 RepID=A0A831RVT4_9GAMM|nr:hypothetical protein [Thiolapillus brandeum]